MDDERAVEDAASEEPVWGGIRWFGDKPFAPICKFSDKQPTPVGQACLWCGELFEEGDAGMLMPFYKELHVPPVLEPWHQTCFLRTISGSLAHQKHECSCYGGNSGEDDLAPGMTKRQEAKLAVTMWMARKETAH